MKTHADIERDARALVHELMHRDEADLAETFKAWIAANYFHKASFPESMSLLTIALLMFVDAAEHANRVSLRTLSRFVMAESGCNFEESYVRAREMLNETNDEMEAEEEAAGKPKQ